MLLFMYTSSSIESHSSARDIILSIKIVLFPLVFLRVVRRDVGGREEAPPVAQLPRPPVLVALVRNRDHVAAPEFKLALLLERKL